MTESVANHPVRAQNPTIDMERQHKADKSPLQLSVKIIHINNVIVLRPSNTTVNHNSVLVAMLAFSANLAVLNSYP